MNKLLLTTVLGASLLTPALAYAATNGSLGSTSTGSLGVRVFVEPPVEPEIQITGLEDINFDDIISGGSGSNSRSEAINNICVFGGSSSTYTLEINSANNQNTNGVGFLFSGDEFNQQSLEYTWRFDDGSGNFLENGNSSNTLIPNAGGSTSCAQTNERSSLTLSVPNTNGVFADTDAFQLADVLTLTVVPN